MDSCHFNPLRPVDRVQGPLGHQVSPPMPTPQLGRRTKEHGCSHLRMRQRAAVTGLTRIAMYIFLHFSFIASPFPPLSGSRSHRHYRYHEAAHSRGVQENHIRFSQRWANKNPFTPFTNQHLSCSKSTTVRRNNAKDSEGTHERREHRLFACIISDESLCLLLRRSCRQRSLSTALVLGDQRAGAGGLVLPVGCQLAVRPVVPSQAVDARLDEDKAELGVLVAAVALQVLAHRHGLLDEHV
ncbi:unnamed protein product, partial [Ectocarpus fasciculatus]